MDSLDVGLDWSVLGLCRTADILTAMLLREPVLAGAGRDWPL